MIVNPIKRAITIRSVKIRFDKVAVPCPCIHKENSSPDEKLGLSPINMPGHCTAEWEIPYEIMGVGQEPRALVIQYETTKGVAKEKVQEPDFISWAIKNMVAVPESAKNRIPPNFEGTLILAGEEDFPAGLGLARKNLLNKARYCFTLNGTGVSIENSTSRTIEIESVHFVREYARTEAYLDEAYAQKKLVPTTNLRAKERAIWILPKQLYPDWQETREVDIKFRVTVLEESFVNTIRKKL